MACSSPLKANHEKGRVLLSANCFLFVILALASLEVIYLVIDFFLVFLIYFAYNIFKNHILVRFVHIFFLLGVFELNLVSALLY